MGDEPLPPHTHMSDVALRFGIQALFPRQRESIEIIAIRKGFGGERPVVWDRDPRNLR